MNYQQALDFFPYVCGAAAIVCLAVGFWFGEIMGHANSGFHDERPFSSLTWRNYVRHFWPNTLYRLQQFRKRN